MTRPPAHRAHNEIADTSLMPPPTMPTRRRSAPADLAVLGHRAAPRPAHRRRRARRFTVYRKVMQVWNECGPLAGLDDQLLSGRAEIARHQIQVPLSAKPLVAHTLITAQADAERRYPSETSRDSDTVNVAGDQVVGEQPRDGFV